MQPVLVKQGTFGEGHIPILSPPALSPFPKTTGKYLLVRLAVLRPAAGGVGVGNTDSSRPLCPCVRELPGGVGTAPGQTLRFTPSPGRRGVLVLLPTHGRSPVELGLQEGLS